MTNRQFGFHTNLAAGTDVARLSTTEREAMAYVGAQYSQSIAFIGEFDELSRPLQDGEGKMNAELWYQNNDIDIAKHRTAANARLIARGLAAAAVAGGLFVSTPLLTYPLALANHAPYPIERPDGDQDGLFDDDEANVYNTDPNNPDTDGDGAEDGEEVFYETDPLVAEEDQSRPDMDEDGLFDNDEEGVYNTDPNNPDTDGDGVGDGQEVEDGTDPLGQEPVLTTPIPTPPPLTSLEPPPFPDIH